MILPFPHLRAEVNHGLCLFVKAILPRNIAGNVFYDYFVNSAWGRLPVHKDSSQTRLVHLKEKGLR